MFLEVEYDWDIKELERDMDAVLSIPTRFQREMIGVDILSKERKLGYFDYRC